MMIREILSLGGKPSPPAPMFSANLRRGGVPNENLYGDVVRNLKG
jgi:hypothetical protein